MPLPNHTPKVAQAIEDIRDLVSLATSDLEQSMGGPLTLEAQLAIRNWIARAYENGMMHERHKDVK